MLNLLNRRIITRTVVICMIVAFSLGYMIYGWYHTKLTHTNARYHIIGSSTTLTNAGTSSTSVIIPFVYSSSSSSSTGGSSPLPPTKDGNKEKQSNNSNTDEEEVDDEAEERARKKALRHPLRWAIIPQGFDDREPYTSEVDDVVCSPISGLPVEDTAYESFSGPWWLQRRQMVRASRCRLFKSMKKCHRTTLTCQWALQGYCFNYTAPNIGILDNLLLVFRSHHIMVV
jgi:hypothetical protein